MIERIVNLFLFIQNDIIDELGAVIYEKSGADEEKIAFLQRQVDADSGKAERFPVPKRYSIKNPGTNKWESALHYEDFRRLARMGCEFEVFREVFQALNIPSTPLVCVTPIVEGKPRIDRFEPIDNQTGWDLEKVRVIQRTALPDYLTVYLTEDGFDIPQLLHDDYFGAIKLLYDNKHYVSAMKLLLSFVDTIAYLEYGDISRNFQKWLDNYANLSMVGITPSELWELRNSLLHMTNLDSRKVHQGKVRRLKFYVGTFPSGLPSESDTAKFFSLMSLIEVVAEAVEQWCKSFNDDSSKLEAFFDRYDRVVSDARYEIITTE
jgi:hypothetical protein